MEKCVRTSAVGVLGDENVTEGREPITRRTVLGQIAWGAAAVGPLGSLSKFAWGQSAAAGSVTGRPAVADRKFSSESVEAFIASISKGIKDKELAGLFANCFPNTLDTTVRVGTFEGKPDTVVLTGDIAAMWLRDSSAQVWPYLPLAKKDAKLRSVLEGVIRRQTRCLLIDVYANSFMADLDAKPLPWSLKDATDMKQGVGERKYELDSQCYPIRLAHGYWQQTGDTAPFDAAMEEGDAAGAGDDAGAAEEGWAGAVSLPAVGGESYGLAGERDWESLQACGDDCFVLPAFG